MIERENNMNKIEIKYGEGTKKDKEIFHEILDEWNSVFRDRSVIEEFLKVEKNGVIIIKGNKFTITFEERDKPLLLSENRLSWREGLDFSEETLDACISGKGKIYYNNIYYCHIEKTTNKEKWVFDFRQLHDTGKTKMHLEGRSDTWLPYIDASAEQDVPIKVFLSAIGRDDVFKAYENFVNHLRK